MFNYENLILLGDFNAVDSDLALTDLLNNPSLVDIIRTNRRSNFQDSKTIETGISDHHKEMIITVLKSEFKKKDSIQINYRSYKNFDENYFRHELSSALLNLLNENTNYDDFKKVYIEIIDLHAPMKKKFVRGNNAPFMNKNLIKSFHA